MRVVVHAGFLLCLGWVKNDSDLQEDNETILFLLFILTVQSRRLGLAFHLLGEGICKFLAQLAKSNSTLVGACPKSTFCSLVYCRALFNMRKAHTFACLPSQYYSSVPAVVLCPGPRANRLSPEYSVFIVPWHSRDWTFRQKKIFKTSTVAITFSYRPCSIQ